MAPASVLLTTAPARPSGREVNTEKGEGFMEEAAALKEEETGSTDIPGVLRACPQED